MISKLFRYGQEAVFAFRTALPGSRWSLIRDTLAFHLSNRFPSTQEHRVGRYGVKVGQTALSLTLRADRGDFFVFYEVMLDQCYSLPFFSPDDVKTVVDLGANIGMTARFFGAAYPAARIIAVEPEPTNFSILQENMRELSECGRVQLIQAAVAPEDGELQFFRGSESWGGRVSSEIGDLAVRAISMETLMRECEVGQIDLLKVDIEGGERSLLESSPRWLSSVGTLVIELHEELDSNWLRRCVEPLGLRVVEPGSALRNRMLVATRVMQG